MLQRQSVQLEDQAHGRPRLWCAQTLPLPAPKLGQGATFFTRSEPGLDARVLAFTQAREDLTHKPLPRAKVVDKHTSVGAQSLSQGAKRQVPHSMRKNIIDGLIEKPFANAGIRQSGHESLPC